MKQQLGGLLPQVRVLAGVGWGGSSGERMGQRGKCSTAFSRLQCLLVGRLASHIYWLHHLPQPFTANQPPPPATTLTLFRTTPRYL